MRYPPARFFPAMLAGLLLAAGLGVAGRSSSSAAPSQTHSLSDGTSLTVSADWAERRNAEVPPREILLTSAPQIRFTELIALENRKNNSLLRLAASDNPFVGSNARTLDAQMHSDANLAAHLFYFFFPPPAPCLAQARAAYRQELHRKDDDENIRVARNCEFSSALADLYAQQVSPGVVFSRRNNVERIDGMLRTFSLPPMEVVVANGFTFYVFEAQGLLAVERAELDRHRLPEELRGAKAYFFWAFGAPSPFPFVADAARKQVPLVHLAYAALSPGGDARSEFLALLNGLHRP